MPAAVGIARLLLAKALSRLRPPGQAMAATPGGRRTSASRSTDGATKFKDPGLTESGPDRLTKSGVPE